MDYERRQVYRGPEDYVDLPADPKELDARIAEALQDLPDNDELQRRGRHRGRRRRRSSRCCRTARPSTIIGDGLKPATSGLAPKANPKTQIRPGAVVRLIRGAKGDWAITQLPEVEGAFVAMDPRTGAIRAMVGGFDYSKSKFNHVTQAWRQPGSSFKPFIYSAALEKGFTPATVINDAPLFFDAGTTGSQPWEPKNYDGTFDGPMTMRRGLAKSKNMISIRILQVDRPAVRAGLDHALRLRCRQASGLPADGARRRLGHAAADGLGLQRLRQRRLSRQSAPDQPHHRLARATSSTRRALPTLDESTRTIDARNAFVMTSLLQEVTRSRHRRQGAGARSSAPTSTARPAPPTIRIDAWFAGLQKSVVGVVWMGYDTPRKLGDRETGGGLALPVWIDYMSDDAQGRAGAGADARPRAWSTSAASGTTRSTRAAPASAASASTTSRRRRRRARKSATASSICSGADGRAGSRSGLEAQRPAGLRAGAGREHVEELAAVAAVDPAPAGARK